MLSNSLLVLALSALAYASPIRTQRRQQSCGQPSDTPVLSTTGTARELTGPTTDMVLKYLVLGHGIQNYTCDVDDSSKPATAAGALAVLYDALPIYPGSGPAAALTVDVFEALPHRAAVEADVPLNLDSSLVDRVLPNQLGANADAPFFDSPDPLVLSPFTLQQTGRHFFAADDVASASIKPVFKVGDDTFVGSVEEKVDAPQDVDNKGPDGQPAVAWLHLSPEEGTTGDLKAAYRVVTVGGSPQACTAKGGLSVPYTAYYWFYG